MLERLIAIRDADGLVQVVLPIGGVIEGVVEVRSLDLAHSLSGLTDPPILGIVPPPEEFGLWTWVGRVIRDPVGYSFVGGWRRPTEGETSLLLGDGKIELEGDLWRA